MRDRTRSRLASTFACCAIFVIGSARVERVSALEGSYESATTTIEVKLDQRLSSQANTAGDAFSFESTGSVMLDGVPVGAGSRGHGVVLAVRPGVRDHAGLLTLAARSLDLADGRHVPVGLASGSLDSRENTVVYEKGTRFTIVAPPPETPAPSESSAAQ